MVQKKHEDPSTVSMSYEAMAPRLARAATLLGGTDAMRDAGDVYLPLHTEETSRGWNERLFTNVLFNFYEITLDQLAGKPFAEPMAFQDDVSDVFLEHAEDIDLQGNTLDSFAHDWFKDALRGAFSHVLVDFPRVDDKINPETGEIIPRTKEDDRKENLRPYWVNISPEQVIFASADRINGVETLTHLRISETVIERVGFAETAIEQIRVYEPGTVEIYRRKDPKKESSDWALFDAYETSPDRIPLVTFYTDREALMQGRPPLDDLAHMNIRHWQSMSDQIRSLTVSRFPMLVTKGVYENEQGMIRVGPEQALSVPADGDIKWLEATGSAIEQGRLELQDLEDRMGSYGAQMMRKRPGNQTATARSLDQVETMSFLQASAVSFQSALEQAMLFHMMWLGEDTGGSINIESDFRGMDESTQAILSTLKEAHNDDVISRPAYVEELKRRDVLREDYEQVKDKILIDQEIAERVALAELLAPEEPEAEAPPETPEED